MFDEIRNWGRLSDIVTATLTEIISFKMTLTKLTMWNSMEVLSTQLILVRHTDPRSQVLNRRSYHQWQSMGAILIVDDPRLVPVFFGTRLPSSEGWKTELAQQGKESGRSVAIASKGESIPGHSYGGAVAHPLCYSCLGITAV